jgi:nitrite reductase (cytochrome c-552)
MRKKVVLWLSMAALSVWAFSGCTPKEAAPAGASGGKVVRVAERGTSVVVKTASDWAQAHPDIYASYMRNLHNEEAHSYVERFPYIATLYEGMGFSHSYNSARGHLFSIEDVNATGRPTPLANCFACKTPNFHAMVNELGDSVYSIPFEEIRAQMVEPISCFTCHGNEPGSLIVTHTYLEDAMGGDFLASDPANLACGQCHVEYYFDPASKAVRLPYTSREATSPDAILSYYNNMDVDGEPFTDFVNPRSGVRQIKVQHPEFETYLGTGSVHAGTFNCADCHMGTEVNAEGKAYTSHEWTSPLNNPALVESTCVQCHDDLPGMVRQIQAVAEGRTHEIGEALAALTEDLVVAVNSGNYDAERLDAVREVFRTAQFYWDFVFVENSEGAHNSKLTHQVLDKAESYLNETRTLMAQL